MFCTDCGTKNADGAKFCTGCGAPLMPSTGVNNGQRRVPAPQSPRRVQEAPVVEERPPIQSDSSTAEQPRPKRKKSTARVVIPVLAAVIIVAAMAVAAIFTNGFGLLGVPVRATVNDYSWEELSKISAQISACGSQEEALEVAKSYNLTNPDGTLDGTQVKQLELTDGTTTEVQILGFYHDDKSDGSGKAGISFVFSGGVALRGMNSTATTAGGWEQSEARTWLNSDFLEALPADLRGFVVPVDKMTNNAGATADPAAVTATSDSLWLLSHDEIVGLTDGSNPGYAAALDAEGTQYQLFTNCGVSWSVSGTVLVKSLETAPGGQQMSWWQRSPAPDTNQFIFKSETGAILVGASPETQLMMVPGFSI